MKDFVGQYWLNTPVWYDLAKQLFLHVVIKYKLYLNVGEGYWGCRTVISNFISLGMTLLEVLGWGPAEEEHWPQGNFKETKVTQSEGIKKMMRPWIHWVALDAVWYAYSCTKISCGSMLDMLKKGQKDNISSPMLGNNTFESSTENVEQSPEIIYWD